MLLGGGTPNNSYIWCLLLCIMWHNQSINTIIVKLGWGKRHTVKYRQRCISLVPRPSLHPVFKCGGGRILAYWEQTNVGGSEEWGKRHMTVHKHYIYIWSWVSPHFPPFLHPFSTFPPPSFYHASLHWYSLSSSATPRSLLTATLKCFYVTSAVLKTLGSGRQREVLLYPSIYS